MKVLLRANSNPQSCLGKMGTANREGMIFLESLFGWKCRAKTNALRFYWQQLRRTERVSW